MSFRLAIASGIRWSSLTQYGQQGLLLVSTAVLSRLLKPSDFGLLSMALVVIRLPIMFKDLGTKSAIIQHADPSEELLSSVFWMNVIFGTLTALLICVAAPWAARFYGEPSLTLPLCALSAILLFWGPRSLLQALLERELQFAAVARAELTGAVAGAAVAVLLGLRGHGVWSLAALHIVGPAVASVMICTSSRWRPSWTLRWSALRGLVRYSGSLTAFNILNFLSRNADYVIIGRVLGAQSLGYYTLAYTLMLYPLKSVSGVIGRGAFPSFARMQRDQAVFKREFLKIAALTAAVTFPMMLALMALCEPFIAVVFGAQWRPAVPLILILAPVGMAQSILTFNGLIYQATGRPDRQLAIEMVLAPLVILSCLAGLRWGITGVAVAYAAMSLVLALPSALAAYDLIELSLHEIAAVLLRPLAAGVALFCVLAGFSSLLSGMAGPAAVLALSVPFGAVIYLALASRLLVPELGRFQGLLRPGS